MLLGERNDAYPNAELKLIPNGKHGFSKADDKTALGYVGEFLDAQSK